MPDISLSLSLEKTRSYRDHRHDVVRKVRACAIKVDGTPRDLRPRGEAITWRRINLNILRHSAARDAAGPFGTFPRRTAGPFITCATTAISTRPTSCCVNRSAGASSGRPALRSLGRAVFGGRAALQTRARLQGAGSPGASVELAAQPSCDSTPRRFRRLEDARPRKLIGSSHADQGLDRLLEGRPVDDQLQRIYGAAGLGGPRRHQERIKSQRPPSPQAELDLDRPQPVSTPGRHPATRSVLRELNRHKLAGFDFITDLRRTLPVTCPTTRMFAVCGRRTRR